MNFKINEVKIPTVSALPLLVLVWSVGWATQDDILGENSNINIEHPKDSVPRQCTVYHDKRRRTVRGSVYRASIRTFITAVSQRCPSVLLAVPKVPRSAKADEGTLAVPYATSSRILGNPINSLSTSRRQAGYFAQLAAP